MFRKQHPAIGASPGTLVVANHLPAPKIHLIHYAPEGAVREIDSEDIGELRAALSPETVTWIDVQGLGDEAAIRRLSDVFDFHPLLLEDIVNCPQRPKAEAYGDQLLLVVRMVSCDIESDEISMEQVSLVLGPNYVVTFQEQHGDVLGPVRRRIRSGKGTIRERGPDYLAYAIVDTIVDAYDPVIESIGNLLEDLEDDVIATPSTDLLHRIHRLKNRLVQVRRVIWPQREAINALARGDHDAITLEVRLYLRDTLDHCVQTSEVVEMFREMTTGLMNTYLTAVANRTNDVMKVLTIVGTIFIPMTFLAGVYGMNFEHMPELHSRWGYPLIWVAMLTCASTMMAFFWRKGWFGPASR